MSRTDISARLATCKHWLRLCVCVLLSSAHAHRTISFDPSRTHVHQYITQQIYSSSKLLKEANAIAIELGLNVGFTMRLETAQSQSPARPRLRVDVRDLAEGTVEQWTLELLQTKITSLRCPFPIHTHGALMGKPLQLEHVT